MSDCCSCCLSITLIDLSMPWLTQPVSFYVIIDDSSGRILQYPSIYKPSWLHTHFQNIYIYIYIYIYTDTPYFSYINTYRHFSSRFRIIAKSAYCILHVRPSLRVHVCSSVNPMCQGGFLRTYLFEREYLAQHQNKINGNVWELHTEGQNCNKQQYYWTGNRF